MNQRDLERAVARATGETLCTIRRFGFSCLDAPAAIRENGRSHPHHVDWDALDARRTSYLPQRCAG